MNRRIRLIKGASYTAKGIHATKKDPEIVVDEAVAEKAVASGFFKFVDEPVMAEKESTETETPEIPDRETESDDDVVLEEMTYTQLKALAAQMGISTKGLKSKDSLVAAINEATEVEPVVASETMLHLQES